MNSILTDTKIYEILSVVEEIPKGKVTTYGRIAEITGREKNARLVGKVLSMSQYYGTYPRHRVVKQLLFRARSCASLLFPHFPMKKKCLWDCQA